MSKRLLHLRLDDLEYAKNRIVMYNELPTKAQLLAFIFDVEQELSKLRMLSHDYCYDCGGALNEDYE